MSLDMEIIPLTKEDLNKVVEIAKESFSGLKEQEHAEKWIECNFSAHPRTKYFIARENNDVLGYILWLEKGGFRKESVWELEQIAVKDIHRGKGIASKLIKESLSSIHQYLEKRGAKLKMVEVTTSTENEAQQIYRKHLNAKIEAVITKMFRGDEVIMVARFF
jgi:predicted N-acetyltransferase YhbS